MIKILAPIILFFILTPGILWSYKKKTNKYVVALLHAVGFVLIWHLVEQYVIHFRNTQFKEGMEPPAKDPPAKDSSDDDSSDNAAPANAAPANAAPTNAAPANANVSSTKEPVANSLKFVLAPDLKTNSALIDRINTMEGPPTIVGANLIFGPDKNKSFLLFTNQKSNTSKLENLTEYDILDPKMKKIKDFIEFHKKYPDML
jgi:hypothetical protein